MLYHKELGLPESIQEIIGQTFTFHFSKHALRACLEDRYGQIIPPPRVTVLQDDIVEIETGEHGVEKAVIRVPYNDRYDLIIVFCPSKTDLSTVKTCWLNDVNDVHTTLDASKYQKLL